MACKVFPIEAGDEFYDRIHELYRGMLLYDEFTPIRAYAPRVGFAWHTGWKATDRKPMVLGRCNKTPDLHRAFHGYDFIIELNAEWWEANERTDAQRAALLHHEMGHIGVEQDNESRVITFFCLPHSIEEFTTTMERFGTWKDDLKDFHERTADASRTLWDGLPEHQEPITLTNAVASAFTAGKSL